MTSDLLPFALAMLAIVLPLLVGWVLVSLQAWRRKRRQPGAPKRLLGQR